MNSGPCNSGPLIEGLFRQQSGRIVSHLARVLGPARIDLAEESVQDAMLRALQTWPHDGVPQNPVAWLFRVAHNAALDAVRRRQTLDRKAAEMIAELERSASYTPGDPQFEEQLLDDQLRMIFMCCHPELSRDARLALSLKVVSGFGVREIARAFLAEESAIAQRLVRAKRTIRDQALTLEIPHANEMRPRVNSVLEVIYFLFNEGYAAHEGEDLIRQDLCREALRLGRLIADSSMAGPQVHALVAFMCLQAARAAARVDDAGDLIPLPSQDRGQWDQQMLALGFHHFDLSIAGDEVTEYHIQAAIAATHARSAPQSVDWPRILELYDQLVDVSPSPVVLLNRAVAVAKVRGAEAGLDAIPVAAELHQYHLWFAVKGLLLLELDRRDEAREALRSALTCRCSEPERRHLERKLAECG